MKYLKVKLKASGSGREESQKQTLKALGLRAFGQERVHPDNPSVRGMLNKVSHLVSFEESASKELSKKEKVTSYRLL